MSDLDILRSIGVHGGDCLEMMRAMPSDSVDSVVCDPPYGISFMGKAWDTFRPEYVVARTKSAAGRSGEAMQAGRYDLSPGAALAFQRFTMEWCTEALRVLKPGGHLVSFCSTRMFHRMGVGVEDAGFEIRDTLHWCYWSGFPKSLDISLSMDKLHEASREVIGSKLGMPGYADTKHTGGMLPGLSGPKPGYLDITAPATDDARQWAGWGTHVKPAIEPAILARKPLSEPSIARNALRWGTGALNIDGCRFKPGDPMWPGPQGNDDTRRPGNQFRGLIYGDGIEGTGGGHPGGRFPANLLYCPKASRAERELGCEGLPTRKGHEAVEREEGSAGVQNPRAGAGRTADAVRNFHPTVKPVRLMRYLCRLVTPPGGTVLVPFAGSGSEMVAAILEGFHPIGAELEAEYVAIARSRIAHAKAYPTSWAHTAPGFVGDASDEVEQALRAGQMGLF